VLVALERIRIMERLQGKIAVITGGSSGIGLATARQFVSEGAHVFITGRRRSELDSAVGQIGKNVTAIEGDVSNLADLDRLYAAVKEQKGHLDIIFANAGGGALAPLGTITEQTFYSTFDINVKGLVFTIQKALPLLRPGGSIILNASINTVKAVPGAGLYSASKAAGRSLARTWSLELKDRQIRINAISPGVIDTPIFATAGFSEEAKQALFEHSASLSPLSRVGKPEEIAAAVTFLASAESSFITGIELFVDGGTAQV
jgi:NAD(P)-dependent dehydrogenase (short-subunit alcohol dehydrogenase family)